MERVKNSRPNKWQLAGIFLRIEKPGSCRGRLDGYINRSFKSFSEAAMECAMSRVYLGIHFRYDSVEGKKPGTRIGNYAWKNILNPVEWDPLLPE